MHKNRFVTTPDSKKHLFRKKVSGVLEVLYVQQNTLLKGV
jgi:hypothetical protein